MTFSYFISFSRWKLNCSETRLLRTLKRNEKRYVLTKVRSIQNAISSLAGPVPRVHANNLTRKMLLRPECRSLLAHAFRAVKSPFIALWTWKRAGKLKSKLKGWMTCLWAEKKNKRKGKMSSWRENWYVISDLCHVLYVLYEKKYMFADWRCPWSTERTL